jgi:hypothetical protein
VAALIDQVKPAAEIIKDLLLDYQNALNAINLQEI